MSHLPQLVNDLALILIIAGITTLLFKRLKQPLILGYILAGFLTGPHMTWFPSVSDTVNIDTWSSIGVIFIMFSLGLEFSFKKIIKMGWGPIIAATSVMVFMISIGTIVGRGFGWNSMNSLFLGGMLAMSSTTVIYKALDELGLRQQKFAGVVLSVLILEDILGILLMVLLSALAVKHQFQGTELLYSLLKLAFFLIMWFAVGIYLVPLFLRRNSKWISKETLLIVSVGLCFLLVVLATKAGYSSAFGAFMMGSILAETLEAERIMKIVDPIKNFFGAIFFVSVGMLVDPHVLTAHWIQILVIVATILIGQTIFGTSSFLLSGQSLKTSVQCGFSLTQIGEFSFILASLGVGLGVTSSYLYPVVVAVSIITTFTTPYMMKLALPVSERLQLLIPDRWSNRLGRQEKGKNATVGVSYSWSHLLRHQLLFVCINMVMAIAVIGMSFTTLLPVARGIFGHWFGNAVCGVVTYVVVALFLRPIVAKSFHSVEIVSWRRDHKWWYVFLFDVLLVIRFILATMVVGYILEFLSPYKWYWHVMGGAVLCLLFTIDEYKIILPNSRKKVRYRNRFAKCIKYFSIRIERTFTTNLKTREWHQIRFKPRYANMLRKYDIHLSQLNVPIESSWGGKTLQDLGFGHREGVMVAAIVRGEGRINIPDGNSIIFPGDKLEVLGDDHGLKKLSQRMETEVMHLPRNEVRHHLSINHFRIEKNSPFSGVSLSKSGIRERFNCMVVGFESKNESDDTIDMPTSDRIMQVGDCIWVVGNSDDLLRLLRTNSES